jgi:glycopeptide antibiotics resistance protein
LALLAEASGVIDLVINIAWRIMLLLWLASVLFVISLPWWRFDGIPHWENVQWIPFTHLSFHPAVLVETAANILAFVPVGYLVIRSFSTNNRNPLFVASLLGFCSSVGIEIYQLFCQGRVPSSSDILTNVGGTALGVWLAVSVDKGFTFCSTLFRRFSTIQSA